MCYNDNLNKANLEKAAKITKFYHHHHPSVGLLKDMGTVTYWFRALVPQIYT
jgi:hypothetical protein